ncbi:diaminopimelate decarboxylase [Oceanirhabdus sp. W0125-5]|uniref:diaminopimelate decarboxylase n=1 Tax=Oceanirhabdus sp. W0125-5 TaxID=2999116 RepID=UPI0022F337EF|nr:diaminopimelate decarboxylase [Oceanirhabdus sp. W0125-5]WBW97153.1 diaminopimelate decarboxylase [Oceanirhabdus sp. W0125-5]
MRFFGTMKMNNNGNLQIGGCDSVKLTKEFGTPLYVVDEDLIRGNCRTFKNNFAMEGIDTEVIYASKAFLNLAICKLISEEGLSLDVVSGGELYTALRAEFPAQKIYMHGNNKTRDELIMAIEAGIGRIVVDNRQELELLEYLCEELDKKIDVLLRVNPGIDAHTHEYIQTSKNDSKFGESIFCEDICSLLSKFKNSRRVTLKGFHCHIGSQIFEEQSFYQGISVMLQFLDRVRVECGFITEELNLGGGFGVYYSKEDTPINLEKCLKDMILLIKEKTMHIGLNVPKIMIEPGRAIIANAGTTLYEVGGTKLTYGGKHFIFVDGGMTDNPRTALYGAKYEAVIANKMNLENIETYTIAGKCCESGDVLVKDIELPEVERKDILAVLSTGAYNYSMASNYNRIPRPAVVFVKDGNAKLTVKRETYEDILRNDLLI